MVPSTDAVPHPRAVVVKFAHTATAGSRRGQWGSTATHETVQGPAAPHLNSKEWQLPACVAVLGAQLLPGSAVQAPLACTTHTRLVRHMSTDKGLFAEGLLFELYPSVVQGLQATPASSEAHLGCPPPTRVCCQCQSQQPAN